MSKNGYDENELIEVPAYKRYKVELNKLSAQDEVEKINFEELYTELSNTKLIV